MMKTLIAPGALALALLTIALAPVSQAGEWDKKTVITVQGGAVQIQGKVLESGTYVLKLVDSQSDRRIVQVFNADETKLETAILANAAFRSEPTGRTAFTFYEMPGAQSKALRTWFYPGDNYGLEFSR